MKPFIVIDAPQRSPEWFAARAGKVTASRAADVLAKIKSGEAAARRNYRIQLVSEILTGQPQEEGFVSPAMQRGIDLEPAAFAAYESVTGEMAQRVGFLAHTELPIGASPDGVIGDYDGIVELKVPLPATHLAYIKAGVLPADYVPQVMHLLLVSGAAYVDFLSYCPTFTGDYAHLQTFLVRVRRADVDLAGYEKELRAFLAEVQREVEALKTLSSPTERFKAAAVA
jgi:putative phage-type endonuclease